MKEKFTVTGMTCSACSSGIERALKKVKGVESAEVSLMGESMSVIYDENTISRESIIACVEGLGYGVKEYDETILKAKQPQGNPLKKRFLFSLLFLVPLLYFSMGGMISLPQPSYEVSCLLQAVLALIVIVLNFKFFTSGAKALLSRVPNMDTLVALGSAASYLYSLVVTILYFIDRTHAAHLFYESAAMILTLVTLGKWLEEKSKRKTGDEVEKLIALMPSTVTVERNGVERRVEFSELAVGDILIVKQGEYIPIDGKVIEGQGFVDRSAITGESLPIEVEEGSVVTGADIVKSGYLKILAQKVGSDTALSQIVKMVKEAGASKAPIQKTADKIAGVFVPVVCLISLVTFLCWVGLTGEIATAANYAISVLVISCPCSLGLATPVAVMAATGRGMSLGVLYKDAEAMQKAKNINCVLLDKTATLTVGQPKVTDFECFITDKDFALRLAYAIESRSNHPIAECIKAYAAQETQGEIQAANYRYETGKGAVAEVDGKEYRLGNRKLLPSALQKQAYAKEKEYAASGKTLVYLSDEKALLAVFALADTLKESSVEAVSLLKASGARVAMLTGDSETVAKAIAKTAGIDEYLAEALPEDKVGAVERIQSVGGFVAMVGDGINDSPALKAADVGVAVGNGTDIAIDSADVVLTHGDLRAVDTMIRLSKATVKNIGQNLFWAFFYNCVAIPVAAGVFAFAGVTLSPMLAAACMSASSLFVVTNALRLTRFDKKKEVKEMEKTLKIKGMMCQHCVAHVTKALQGVEGVESVEVNLKKGVATVTLGGVVDEASLRSVVEEAGYEVKSIS